jgi:hypothetical protein
MNKDELQQWYAQMGRNRVQQENALWAPLPPIQPKQVMADNKIAPAVGMRVKCRGGLLGTVIATRPAPSGVIGFDVAWDDSDKQFGYRSNCSDWGPMGTCWPADPTPEPPAAKWKQGDGYESEIVLVPRGLRPEAAPAAPVGDWVSGKEHAAVKAELEAARRSPNIERYGAMLLADARAERDRVMGALADTELQLASATREVTRLRTELKAARDQLRRRGGL